MPNEQTSVPLFVANTVLTASQQNLSAGTGVPVFATTVTRDAAFGGSNKALAEGQLCYLSSTNVVQYYDGAAWATVGPTASKVAQVLSTTKTDTFTLSAATTTYTDVTGLSVSITPTLNTSKILVFFNLAATAAQGVSPASAQIVRGATALSLGDTAGSRTVGTAPIMYAGDTTATATTSQMFLDSPATTSSTTYKIQVRSNVAGTVQVNRSPTDGNVADYGRYSSSITVMEVLA